MSDVTIPAAEWSRISQFVRTWARRDNPLKDLVEKYDPPKPRTLRDEAIAALDCGLSSYEEYADAVLAVVKARLDALPTQFYAGSHAIDCRDIDALFGDGGAS